MEEKDMDKEIERIKKALKKDGFLMMKTKMI